MISSSALTADCASLRKSGSFDKDEGKFGRSNRFNIAVRTGVDRESGNDLRSAGGRLGKIFSLRKDMIVVKFERRSMGSSVPRESCCRDSLYSTIPAIV